MSVTDTLLHGVYYDISAPVLLADLIDGCRDHCIQQIVKPSATANRHARDVRNTSCSDLLCKKGTNKNRWKCGNEKLKVVNRLDFHVVGFEYIMIKDTNQFVHNL